jgi:hypothetical protein
MRDVTRMRIFPQPGSAASLFDVGYHNVIEHTCLDTKASLEG